jgi:hypothetical protein
MFDCSTDEGEVDAAEAEAIAIAVASSILLDGDALRFCSATSGGDALGYDISANCPGITDVVA